MSFLISNAFAEAVGTTPTQSSSSMASLLMLVGFLVIFYLMLWRPQAKRAKEHRALISNLARGDEVLTSGGLVGRVNKISDDFVTLEIANGVEIKVQKSSIANVLPKGTFNATV